MCVRECESASQKREIDFVCFLGHLSFWENYKAWGPSYNLPKNKTKIRPRSTYPKKLDSEARLRNGKVLGTHSVQTEFSLLDSHDQCTPFMHDMKDILHT